MVASLLILALLVALLAELAHLRRCFCLRGLLFGACHFPWKTMVALAVTRLAGISLLAAGGFLLLTTVPHPAELNSMTGSEEMDRLLILLDCSKSMDLRDAGEQGDLSRGQRAAQLIQDMLHEEDRELPRTSLVVFADEAMPLAIDTVDWQVLTHSINNRSLSEVLFDDEQTTIGGVLQKVFRLFGENRSERLLERQNVNEEEKEKEEEEEEEDLFTKNWPERSTVLLLITDGDSADQIQGLQVPRAIRRVVVAGVGSAEGKMIGSFQSRRDDANLEAIAAALRGTYFNGNKAAVPVSALDRPPAPLAEIRAAEEAALGQLPPRPAWPLLLLGVGCVLLTAAMLAGGLLNPARGKPIHHHESARFLS